MSQQEHRSPGMIRERSRLAGTLVLALVVVLGAGCQMKPIPESERAANFGKPMEWVDPNGKRDEARYKADFDECYKAAYGYSDDLKSNDKSYEFRRCMRLKGWHEVPAAAPK